jgi:hypothetical protein
LAGANPALATLVCVNEFGIDDRGQGDEIIAKALPGLVPVADGAEDARLEPTDRVIGRQQIVTDFYILDDCILTLRKFHRLGAHCRTTPQLTCGRAKQKAHAEHAQILKPPDWCSVRYVACARDSNHFLNDR